MQLIEQVSHDHGIDLVKLSREFDARVIIEREQANGMAFGPFHMAWQLERAPEKVQKILAEMKYATASGVRVLASKQGFVASDYTDFPSASLRTAINTTITETNLWDPAILAPLPVGEIRSGKGWGLAFGGVMGTTATPTIAFRARCGTNNSAPPTGTDLGIGPTVTLGTFTAQPFHGEGKFGCRTIGVAASTATITGNGFVVCPAAAAATVTPVCVFGGAIPTTIDQTVAQGLSVSVTWGASSASNTITPQWLMYNSRN